jgi:hypothetical protein
MSTSDVPLEGSKAALPATPAQAPAAAVNREGHKSCCNDFFGQETMSKCVEISGEKQKTHKENQSKQRRNCAGLPFTFFGSWAPGWGETVSIFSCG